VLFVRQRVRREPSRAVRLAVEGDFVDSRRRVDEDLRDARQRGRGKFAAHRKIERHGAPAGNVETFVAQARFEFGDGLLAQRRLRREETSPDAKWSASTIPASAASARNQPSGRCSRMPQPSPERPSAPTAPRCAMRCRAANARSTKSRLAIASICAIRPNPQLSFS
jgi:hypothetical protein